MRGHRLPLRRPGTRIAGERTLLVGDAAGLIDPVSGDGMYECFVSATLAAAAIADLLAGRAASLVAYQGAIDPPSVRCTVRRGSSRKRSTAGLWRAGGSPAPTSSGGRSSGCCSQSCPSRGSSEDWLACRYAASSS